MNTIDLELKDFEHLSQKQRSQIRDYYRDYNRSQLEAYHKRIENINLQDWVGC